MYSTNTIIRQLMHKQSSQLLIHSNKYLLVPYISTAIRFQSTATNTNTQNNHHQQGQSSSSSDQGGATGKQSFFRSDSWTKTVGTIGALANWTLPMAAITHMMTKSPDTIDPRMVCNMHRMYML